jgi:hypothetical protein
MIAPLISSNSSITVIKFVSDLQQVCGLFSPGTPVSSNSNTDRHDITEILLKVAQNTIIIIYNRHISIYWCYRSKYHFTFLLRPVDLLCDDKLIYAYAAAFGCSSSAILVLLITHEETLLSLDIPYDIRPWVQGKFI